MGALLSKPWHKSASEVVRQFGRRWAKDGQDEAQMAAVWLTECELSVMPYHELCSG